jgi:DNA-binding NarL/FixJ family response regulator
MQQQAEIAIAKAFDQPRGHCVSLVTKMETRLLIIDDHPLFRDAMRMALASTVSQLVIAEAGNLDDARARLASDEPIDLVLLDLKMPGVQGLSGLAYIRASYPGIPVAIVSGQEDAAVIRRAMALGAAGFVPKSTPADQMRDAIKVILSGEVWTPEVLAAETPEDKSLDSLARRMASLTPQQLRVLMMLKEGKLNKQIAYELDVTEATVKAHVSAILLKLDVNSRTQAVIAAGRIDGEAIGETLT